jgi:hypothetical protein
MSPKHGPWRAEVRFRKVAEDQLTSFTLAELIAVDRAVVTVSTNPLIGEQVSEESPVREYRDPETATRVFYIVADRNLVTVVYIEP